MPVPIYNPSPVNYAYVSRVYYIYAYMYYIYINIRFIIRMLHPPVPDRAARATRLQAAVLLQGGVQLPARGSRLSHVAFM